MKLIRTGVSVAALVLLLAGYLASAHASLSGSESAVQYARQVDEPPIRLLALFILVVSLVLAFVPDREANGR